MCGISGIFNFNGESVSSPIITAMTDSIKHRGPDGSGQFIEASVGLGHVRLAIIDLSDGGKQPMATPDDRYVIVYNGELYNFQELRTELQARGITFTSRSDTEVILKAFAYWGNDAFSRFNGMFGLAIWDRREKVLTIARDNLGVKPIYIAKSKDKIVFASEIKAIFATGLLTPKLDIAGLREYLTFQNFLAKNTIFDGVEIVPPGTVLQINALGDVKAHKFFEIEFNGKEDNRSENEITEELAHLFSQAVTRQLISDVPVGAYLSGGMDSGSIVAVAARNISNLRTFTCGFDVTESDAGENHYDERRDAELMSCTFDTEHYEVVLHSQNLEKIMIDLVHHLEEPRVGQSYPNYFVARLASKFNRVTLAGAGGDELFGGYPWRYVKYTNGSNQECKDGVFNYWQRLLRNEDAETFFAPIWKEVKEFDPRNTFDEVFGNMHGETPEDQVNAIMTFEAKTFLHGLLVVSDKIAMAHSLEERVPFIDNDLIDFASKLSPKYKIKGYPWADRSLDVTLGATNAGKAILRKALAPRLPEVIANRQKQGFSAPDAGWFLGPLANYVENRVGNARARIYRVLNFIAIKQHLDSLRSNPSQYRLIVWSLLYLEQLFEEYNLA